MVTDSDEAPLLAEKPLRPGACSCELELREFRDRYVIRSLDGGGRGFAVARSDGSLRTLSPEEAAAGNDCKVSRIYGVVGTIKLLAGESPKFCEPPQIILLSCLGLSVQVILSNALWSELNWELCTCYHVSKRCWLLSGFPGVPCELDEILMLQRGCKALHKNLQRASKLAAGRIHKPLWKQLDEFTIPVIQGSSQSVQFTFKDASVRITLFSRRCNRHLGTHCRNKMWRRGANLEGATANFVETEQMVEYEGFTSSFIQVDVHLSTFKGMFGRAPELQLHAGAGDEVLHNSRNL